MRILLVSDNFAPESNAPANRALEHGRAWVRAGHQVTVITGVPNFPAGKVHAGYTNRWIQIEHMEGIRVVRVKTYIAANAGFVRRTLDYLSFMLTAFVAGLFQPRPDVVIGTSPQFFCALGAWALATVRRVPFVMEVRDLWPASIVAVGALKPGRLVACLERVELMLYARAHWIVVVTEAFRDDLVARGVAESKIDVVWNGVDLAKFAPAPRNEPLLASLDLDGKFVVGYLGTVGMAHAIDAVLDAAEVLQDEPDIAILIVGAGAAWARVEADREARGLDNVVMLGVQPRERMPAFWSICDVALIHLKDTPLFATVIPSKLFEAMAMARPVLVAVPPGEATALAERTGAGRAVEPENAAALSSAIRDLARDPAACARHAEAGRQAVRAFSRESQAARMLVGLCRVGRR